MPASNHPATSCGPSLGRQLEGGVLARLRLSLRSSLPPYSFAPPPPPPNTPRRYGNTALHIASKKGHAGAVSVLLDHHAEMHCRNAEAKSAIDLAADNGHSHIVTLLYEVGGGWWEPAACRTGLGSSPRPLPLTDSPGSNSDSPLPQVSLRPDSPPTLPLARPTLLRISL